MTFRTLLFLGALTFSANANAQSVDERDRNLSVGLQTGQFLNQGVSFQYVTPSQSGVNASLGSVLGTSILTVDWAYFFQKPTGSDYNSMRRWQPYAGVGMQSGWLGGVRATAGVQYGLVSNPLNWFASVHLSPGLQGLAAVIGIRYES